MMRYIDRCMEVVSAPSGSGAFGISTSSGWFSVAGYPGKFQTFASTAGVASGDTFFYAAYDLSGSSNTECGLGTYSSGSLARTTILESSNSNNPCVFSGNVTVFAGVPALWFLPGYAVSAAGTTQGTATVLTQRVSIVTSASAGQGVILNSYLPEQIVLNATAISVLVYPPSGAQFNAAGTNVGLSLYQGNGVTMRQQSATQWYSM